MKLAKIYEAFCSLLSCADNILPTALCLKGFNVRKDQENWQSNKRKTPPKNLRCNPDRVQFAFSFTSSWRNLMFFNTGPCDKGWPQGHLLNASTDVNFNVRLKPARASFKPRLVFYNSTCAGGLKKGGSFVVSFLNSLFRCFKLHLFVKWTH